MWGFNFGKMISSSSSIFLLLTLLWGGWFQADGAGNSQASASRSEWNLTFDFMELYNSKDLVVYFTLSSPSPDLVSLAFKEPLENVQIGMLSLTSNLSVPDFYYGSEVPSVKLFLLEEDDGGGGGGLGGQLSRLGELSEQERWTTVNVWLVRLPGLGVDVEAVREAASDLALEYTSQLFVFAEDGSEGFDVYEVYKISRNDSEAEVLKYGKWRTDGGLRVDEAHIWNRRANLKGKHFKISALPNTPYETMVVDGCQGPECFRGMFPDVFHEIQGIMNFTYTMHMPGDGEWGAKREDGSWTGIIGQLANREVDVSPADFRITALRGPVVDFLPPIDEPHQRLFIANPAESFNWYAYVNPYTSAAWTAICLALLLLPPAAALLITRGDEPNKKSFGLAHSYAFVAGSVVIRDWSPAPASARGRVVFFAVLFFGTLVYYHWEAMIISYLAMRTITLPFTSMEQLITETDFKIVVQYGTAFVDTFRYGNTPILQRAWKERVEPYLDEYPKTKEGLTEWIQRDGKSAMLDNFNTRVYYADYIKCETVDIPKKYFPMQYAMPVAKDFPYFDALWHHMNTLKERGAMKQIKERYRTEPQKCPEYSGKPLGFGQTFTAFGVLLCGLAAGALLFSAEILVRPRMLLGLGDAFTPSPLKRPREEEVTREIRENEKEIRRLEETNLRLRKRLHHHRAPTMAGGGGGGGGGGERRRRQSMGRGGWWW